MNRRPDRYIVFFKDSDRILLSPFIPHFGGFSVNSEWFKIVKDLNNNVEVGNAIFKAIEVIETSPLSELSEEERKKNALWKRDRKYRSFISFWRSNNVAYISQYVGEEYKIYSSARSTKYKGTYRETIKKLYLPPTASAEELGKAVLDVLQAAEDFYANADLEQKS